GGAQIVGIDADSYAIFFHEQAASGQTTRLWRLQTDNSGYTVPWASELVETGGTNEAYGALDAVVVDGRFYVSYRAGSATKVAAGDYAPATPAGSGPAPDAVLTVPATLTGFEVDTFGTTVI